METNNLKLDDIKSKATELSKQINELLEYAELNGFKLNCFHFDDHAIPKFGILVRQQN